MIRNLSQYLFNKIFFTLVLIISALSLFPQSSIYAADVALAWDANTEADLAGYYIYYKTGASGAPYDGTNSPIKVPIANLNDSANPQYTIYGLSDTETTFFAVTAYDTENNESGYSNEVSYQPASAPTFSSLFISGADLVDESSNSDYVSTAMFSNGTTQIVTESTEWSVDSPYAQINSSGKLTTSAVPSDTTITLQTSYTTGGVTRTASKIVTITDIPVSVTLSSLSINGDDFVNENNSSSYTATATFSDGTTQTVTSSAGWSVGSAYANINPSGLMTTSEVSGDMAVTVQASYSENGITKTATMVVTIIDVPASNLPPSTPAIGYPENGQYNIEIPLTINTEPFSDSNDDPHKQSQWQISDQSDFSTLVLDVISDNYLTTLPVPYMVLKSNQKYYARVRFYDFYSESSEWSTTIEFTTSSFSDDLNSNGIPDPYEVEDTVDFNGDGIPDNDQPDIIKCVQTVDGAAYIGVEKISDSISEIEALEMIDPETISDTVNRPDDLIFGLIAYRLRVTQPGDIALVKIYFSGEVFTSDTLFKYDTINGWIDYSNHTTFDGDKQSVTLELKDGGYGDSDGLANGVIIDPSGIASEESTYSVSDVSAGGSGGGGGCFIATAAFGSKFEKHVQLLRRFRDLYLMPFKMGRAFVKTYYRYSPPVAEFIADHNILRAMVRWSLIPLIGLSWMLLHFGIVPTLFFLFFISCSTLLRFKKILARTIL